MIIYPLVNIVLLRLCFHMQMHFLILLVWFYTIDVIHKVKFQNIEVLFFYK